MRVWEEVGEGVGGSWCNISSAHFLVICISFGECVIKAVNSILLYLYTCVYVCARYSQCVQCMYIPYVCKVCTVCLYVLYVQCVSMYVCMYVFARCTCVCVPSICTVCTACLYVFMINYSVYVHVCTLYITFLCMYISAAKRSLEDTVIPRTVLRLTRSLFSSFRFPEKTVPISVSV